jgi:hypothetical protein
MSEIIVRPATIADLPTLKSFEQGIIATERPFNDCLKQEHFCYYDLAQLIQSDDSTVMVASDNGQLVGSGRGINQLVITQLIAWGKQQGLSDFYLEAYEQNKPALSAYKKLGFAPSLVELKLSL